ncbi:MAG TPA: ATP-binding protein [Solirubrobacterales bacterium]|nr:ATP-binding protein [Solirubrobacterales bacterium]
MIKRSLEEPLRAALADTPVALVIGARQTGKSTLVTAVAGGNGARYLSFDDPILLGTARSDPVAFVEGLDGVSIIDEVQRAPEILLPIKASVDRDRRPGRFLFTGSANPLFVPEVAEALAGRMEVLTLWPFSAAELEGRDQLRVAKLLLDPGGPPRGVHPVDREDLALRIVRGGFPEAVEREVSDRSSRWFTNYLTAILERDVRALGDITRLEQLPKLLTAVALRSRGPLNRSGLSQELAIPLSSVERYLLLLERIFLVKRLPAWHNRLGPRLVKAPKLLLCDSGLLCNLLRWDEERLLSDPTSFGLALEGFVGIELAKAADLDPGDLHLMHYRTSKGVEVDFVLEAADGRVAAIEVKASSTVGAADFRRFDRLRETLGSRFVRGVVFYTGDQAVPFGKDVAAWPVSLLWGGA